MAWNLTKIPKTAHFFWDGKPLSFLRWASINSFSALNPEWALILHMTKDDVGAQWSSRENKQVNCADYRDWLGKLPNLEIVEEDAFAGMHGVYQSDLLRTKYLSDDGGLWSDADIIYHKPMNALECNLPGYADHDCGLCWSGRWFPIGFMFGAPGSNYFETVHQSQCDIRRVNGRRKDDYQRYGTRVFSSVFQALDCKPVPIDIKEVYQKRWRRHAEIFSGAVDLRVGIGVHWYGGSQSAAKFEPQITHKNWHEYGVRKMLEVTI